MRKLGLALMGLTCLASTSAHALTAEKQFPRWYLGLSGTVNFLNETDASGAVTGKTEYDTGYGGNVSLGYMAPFGGWGNNIRIELDGGGRLNDIDKAVVAGITVPAGGHVSIQTYTGNVLYDFRNTTPWTPYVGAGAGIGKVGLSRRSGLGNTGTSDTVFAYQLMTGISYSPTTLPNTEWSLGYRFIGMEDPEFAHAGGRVKLQDVSSHNVEVGAKFRF